MPIGLAIRKEEISSSYPPNILVVPRELMLLDVERSLRLAAPFAPSGLVSPAAWAKLRAIPAILPAAIVVGTFESRLDGSEQVDYQICFTTKSGGRDKLAAWLGDVDLNGVDPTWKHPLGFLRRWASPGTLVFDHSPAAWLEFDADLADPQPPIPFPFFTLPLPWEDNTISRSARDATAEAGLAALAGCRLDAETMLRVRESLAVLPPSGCLLHAALRPVGTTNVVRLIVRMPGLNMPRYLERAGWNADMRPFAKTLERLCTTRPVRSFQVDVTGSGIGPQIGIGRYR